MQDQKLVVDNNIPQPKVVKISVGPTLDQKYVVLSINDQPVFLSLQNAWQLAGTLRSTANKLGHNQERQRHKKK